MATDTRVTSIEHSYDPIFDPEPYVNYEFGRGKKFMSNFAPEGIYGKPVSIVGGVTTHLPDPDLNQ
jgi:hypothetical protein